MDQCYGEQTRSKAMVRAHNIGTDHGMCKYQTDRIDHGTCAYQTDWTDHGDICFMFHHPLWAGIKLCQTFAKENPTTIF